MQTTSLSCSMSALNIVKFQSDYYSFIQPSNIYGAAHICVRQMKCINNLKSLKVSKWPLKYLLKSELSFYKNIKQNFYQGWLLYLK